MSRTHRARRSRTLALALVLAALGGWYPATALAVDRDDRVQLHRNASRGVDYLPLGKLGEPVKEGALGMRIVDRINLDGSASVNVFSSVLPIERPDCPGAIWTVTEPLPDPE